MRFAVTYLKVREFKDGHLEFEGPIIGPVVPSRTEAETRAKNIVNSTRNGAIMPKIYAVKDDFTIESVLEICTGHFARMRKNIEESKEISNKPIRRSK